MNRGEIRSAIAGPVGRAAMRVAERAQRRTFVGLEYPASADPRPRWGYGHPAHPQLEQIIAMHDDRYHARLETILSYRDALARIEMSPTAPGEPRWVNGYLPGLDSAALYVFVRSWEPALYLEVGSGSSTAFVARARRDGGLGTKIVSIDPSPRREIDALCDEVLRTPLETADLRIFDRLQPGDVVFFDGSHRVFMNSDVTVFFLDLLPQFPPGVLVGVHDIYLPDDYEPHLAAHHYSEQYLLAACLLAGAPWVHPFFAGTYVSRQPAFAPAVDRLWALPELSGVERHAGAFWFTTSTP